MAAHAINRTCVGCCPLSIHKNTNTSCDSNSRNSSVTSLHHHNDDNDDDLKCLIQLYRSIPDYRDVNHLSELEFYDTLQLLKETSKELRTPTKVHAATCHSHFGLPTFCPPKKLKSKKKKSRKSILASSLSVLPSKNCHEIHKSQVKDMKFLKPNSIKELKEAKVNEMKESNDAILINDVHNTIANKQNEICAKNFLQESVSVTPASTTSKTLERFTDRRKDDITNDNNNTTPESKKCLRKDVISPKDSSQSIQNIIKSKEHKTTKIQNRLKDTSISSVHLATRPNLAATLRLECGKKKIKELTKDFHYPDRTGTSSSLFDWEIRKSPSWKALSSNESHKKLLAVKLATRKAEQALLKHEYELNMEIMRQRVKSAPLLFERTNYWTTNVGDTVFCSGAASTPITLIDAMVEHAKKEKLQDITVCHMHTEGKAAYCDEENCEIFRSNSFFMGGNVRKAVADGRGDNMSIFLHEIPKLFYRKIVQPDVALIHVSPPDSHGFCSLGTSVDCVRAALIHSKYIIAQINKQMPRTFGDACIHSSHFDACTEIDTPLPQHGGKPPSEVEQKIGKLIAENLVADGATLQMGIGNIPDAVLIALHNHKDLGIHSEMFANGVVDLVNAGAVTNRFKPLHQGRIVGSFLIGNKKLYDFVNNNPSVEMYAIDYVNSVSVIKTLPRMTAINSAIEVDLTGQVCADSIGTRFFSGFGGQVDFIRGAAEGTDGKGIPIIALPAVTKKKESKIVPILKPGAGVVTSRAHVHYVVTEYGIAFLFGKNMRQRAYELIQIAHPDHREALEKAAYERLKVMPSKC